LATIKSSFVRWTIKFFVLLPNIKAWAVAESTERLDLNNGFLLCPNHDHLFDKDYINFDNKGHIMISPQLNEIDQTLFRVFSAETIELIGK